MNERLKFWHHFILCAILTIGLLNYPSYIFFSPWITFQVLILKQSSQFKGVLFHFFLGIFYSLIGSSLKLGVFSLILCLNYFSLIPLKRSFIDDQILASSLCAAIFGMLFSIGEFTLYQIFFSDIPFSISKICLDLFFKLITDFIFSAIIFSWLYFVNFSILKIKQAHQRAQEEKLAKVKNT